MTTKNLDATCEWRTGYHLTAFRNLDSIMTYGLQPYELDKGPEWPWRGIWLWLDEGSDMLDEAGSVVQRMIDHQTTQVTSLSVRWQKNWEWADGKYPVHHRGTFYGNKGSSWTYHEARAARIVIVPIAPEFISVNRTYDLATLVRS